MEPMIDSGAERERFSEIVQQVGDTLTYINKNQIFKDEANINDVSILLRCDSFVFCKMQLCMEGSVAFFMFEFFILQPSNAWLQHDTTSHDMIYDTI
jgi:hypothetical protein